MGTRMVFNGVNIHTGDYATPPMDTDELAEVLLQSPRKGVESERAHLFEVKEDKAGVRDEYDPKNLAEVGWGVVFARDADPNLTDALQPLISWRREQIGDEGLVRVLCGDQGYSPGQTKNQFLANLGVYPVGPVDPDQMSYYLLLVGSPLEIPFEFQYELDFAYAVGRLHFDDVDAYRRYAESVVKTESDVSGTPRCDFFGTANENDDSTQLSARHLIAPLAKSIDAAGVSVNNTAPEDATCDNLAALLSNGGSPRMVFTATHGLEASGHVYQSALQGALITQEWKRGFPLERSHYFAAEDIDEDADLTGTIAFLFACYGAGCPEFLNFPIQPNASAGPPRIAAKPFLAALPQTMLGRTQAALAVVGHVDKAWSYSFDWPQVGHHTKTYEDTLMRLFRGYPIGHAMEMINEQAAELSVSLHDSDARIGTADELNSEEIAGLWTATNDSRNYVILGDPAVRLTSHG